MLQDGAPPASCVGGDTAFSETATSGTAVYLRGKKKKKKIDDAHVDNVCAAPPFPQSPPSAPLCSSAAVLRHQRGSGVTSKAGDAAVIRALTSSVPQNPAWVPFFNVRLDPTRSGDVQRPIGSATQTDRATHRCSCGRPLQCRVPDLNELCTISRGDSAT